MKKVKRRTRVSILLLAVIIILSRNQTNFGLLVKPMLRVGVANYAFFVLYFGLKIASVLFSSFFHLCLNQTRMLFICSQVLQCFLIAANIFSAINSLKFISLEILSFYDSFLMQWNCSANIFSAINSLKFISLEILSFYDSFLMQWNKHSCKE